MLDTDGLINRHPINAGYIKLTLRYLIVSIYVLTGSNGDLFKSFLGEYEARTDEYAWAHCQAEANVEIRRRNGLSFQFCPVSLIHDYCKHAARSIYINTPSSVASAIDFR